MHLHVLLCADTLVRSSTLLNSITPLSHTIHQLLKLLIGPDTPPHGGKMHVSSCEYVGPILVSDAVIENESCWTQF